MLDFVKIDLINKSKSDDSYILRPKFVIKKSSDLMIRGGDFYAIWVDERGQWSTDEFEAMQLIDACIDEYVEEHPERSKCTRGYLWDSSSGSADAWRKYCTKQMPDNFHMLDEKLVFSSDPVNKKDYSSKRLPYALEKGDYPSWNKLVGTLYSEEERHKIEWSIGAIVTGDSKTLQKFMVFYGAAGTGKSTILNVIQMLFQGYYSVFDARALGSSSNSFALEAFSSNPLVAIQHDGDLSRIEDNTRINSLVSHEQMTVNEKFKSTYSNAFKAFLYMGTNKPVKITDAKSGLLRRLIDVSPSGEKVSQTEYRRLVKNVGFELGAIASHCKDVYEADRQYYDDYIPISMMGASNDFYNFVSDSYFTFKRENGVSLKQAWEMYTLYCDDAKVLHPSPKRIFKEELKNYFTDFNERYTSDDGVRIRNYYSGFKTMIFEEGEKDESKTKAKRVSTNDWILLQAGPGKSRFDECVSECLAQYANSSGTPNQGWSNVQTTLKDIDTSRVHYVKVPENHIVIDFDIPGDDGKKSLELNLAAANKWPQTYAELSKSGEGLHLHYLYSGDVSKLARIYDEHIEIKVFTGGSALRRKLTKYNDIDVSTISSGLPLKGEKVINSDVIKNEKHLRTLIIKNLNKEIHNATKPSVDFIAKLLNDAYESGMSYDVSDLEQDVLNFAAASTNQSDICIKTVMGMKFKSDDIPNGNVDVSDKPIAFYDIEVFPNLFLVEWKIDGIDNEVVRMINPTSQAIEEFVGKFRLIGFNCRRYDNHILYARGFLGYSNEQIYNLSQGIIKGENGCLFGNAYNLSYTDIYDFASAGNKKSLKKLEIEMSQLANDPNSKMDDNVRALCKKIRHHELGLPWDKPVPKELWEKVAEYCQDDVLATEAAFHYLKGDWTARQILAELAGMTVNDTTNSLTTRIIFGSEKHPTLVYTDLATGKQTLCTGGA